MPGVAAATTIITTTTTATVIITIAAATIAANVTSSTIESINYIYIQTVTLAMTNKKQLSCYVMTACNRRDGVKHLVFCSCLTKPQRSLTQDYMQCMPVNATCKLKHVIMVNLRSWYSII